MTVKESLVLINSYPIPGEQVEKICILRELDASEEFTKALGEGQAYELATADTYWWLSWHPSIVEQEVGINNAQAIKEDMRNWAQIIYGKYGDPKFTGGSYGFVGEDYNG